jgi:hypothetical protein
MSSGMQDLYWPDIMCQHCFGGFKKEELWQDEAGEYWDVCKPCKAHEDRAMALRDGK